MKMHLTFSADIQAADEESRTLAGQIVPFGKPGNTSAGKVVFAEGSFVELDPKNVKLLLEHDGTKPIGKAIEFSITESGIDGKLRLQKLLVVAIPSRKHFSDSALVFQWEPRCLIMRWRRMAR
jgi:phage head maturation protease